MFDGLDMHLYTAVALPFVAELLRKDVHLQTVAYHGSLIQAAFLVGWAVGGGFFGRIGDRMGRARALMLTILTYALFTGLSALAQTWWHLLIFRFLAALGIGGEWAVGAALLSETWPRRWRPWIAAVLQSAVNIGIVLAMAAVMLLTKFHFGHRTVFLVGILPALMVLWIRRAVPETAEWRAAKTRAGRSRAADQRFVPRPAAPDHAAGDRGLLAVAVRTLGLHVLVHAAFPQSCRGLPGSSEDQKTGWVSLALTIFVGIGIPSNFVAAAIARRIGYRRAIAIGCAFYFAAVAGTVHLAPLLAGPAGVDWADWSMPRDFRPVHDVSAVAVPHALADHGGRLLLQRGRIAAAVATVLSGTLSQPGDFQAAIVGSSFLFLPAAASGPAAAGTALFSSEGRWHVAMPTRLAQHAYPRPAESFGCSRRSLTARVKACHPNRESILRPVLTPPRRPTPRRCRGSCGCWRRRNRVGLVTGLEVKDAALADRKGDALPRRFLAAVGPGIDAVEDVRFRLGNLEGLGVALGVRDAEIADARGDRMLLVLDDHFQLAAVLDIAALPTAVRAQEGLEGLGVMGRVQGDETHAALLDAIDDPLDVLVSDLPCCLWPHQMSTLVLSNDSAEQPCSGSAIEAVTISQPLAFSGLSPSATAPLMSWG